MFIMTSLPRNVCSLRMFITFSVSVEDSPDVGSSRKSTDGSRISSSAIFSRFRCPPDIVFSIGDPALRSFVCSSCLRVSVTRFPSSSSLIPSKQRRAVYIRFSYTVSSDMRRSSCGTYPMRAFTSGDSMLWPFIVMSPLCGFSVPLRSDSSVVLPAPDPPIMATSCPLLRSKERLCMPLILSGKWKLMSLPANCIFS